MIHLVYQIAVPVSDGTIAYQAYHVECGNGDNLMNWLEDRRICAANVFPTKKRAEEITNFWNDCFRKNGTLFEEAEE